MAAFATTGVPVVEPVEARETSRSHALRILYLTASADGDSGVDKEIRRVKAGTRAATNRDLLQIEHLPAATGSDLLDGLTRLRPHVVHFSGHADEDVLEFDGGGDGSVQGNPIRAELFAQALRAVDEPPRLVVLNSPRTEAHLTWLLEVVPVAVAMPGDLRRGDATVFAARFYRALADGQSVAGAYRLARVQLEMVGVTEGLPVLRHPKGTDPAAAVLLRSASSPVADPPKGDTMAEGSNQAPGDRGMQQICGDSVRVLAAERGWETPPDWSPAGLDRLLDGAAPSHARDAVTALRDALEARPVFTAIGGDDIGLSRLRCLYRHAVGAWPMGTSGSAMLAEAATAAVCEAGSQHPRGPFALARLMLSVAHEAGLGPDHPGLADWLRLTHQQTQDVQDFLEDNCRRPAWVLVQLDEPNEDGWPTQIKALRMTVGETTPLSMSAQPCEEGLRESLAAVLGELLHRDDTLIDLVVPRGLLHRGVERWPLDIYAEMPAEALVHRFRPWLRWSGRRDQRILYERCRKRWWDIRWQEPPVRLSAGPDGGRTLGRELQQRRHAPYVLGRESAPAGRDEEDPLLTVLREGHGRVLWFPHHASDDTLDDVVDLVRKVVSDGPLEDCPDHLLNLDPVAPAIIWDDPDGRAGYRLPWAPAQRP